MATRAKSLSAIRRPIHTEMEYNIMLYLSEGNWATKKSMLKKWNSLYILSVKLNLLMWFSISELCDNRYPPFNIPPALPLGENKGLPEIHLF